MKHSLAKAGLFSWLAAFATAAELGDTCHHKRHRSPVRLEDIIPIMFPFGGITSGGRQPFQSGAAVE
jgi:hypothetical protein